MTEPAARTGPLAGLTVIECSHELTEWAGKLLGDLGAAVLTVEPPGGARQRTYGPFLDDEPGPERSLWWWYYNTGKSSVVVDRATEAGRAEFVELVATRHTDVVLAAEPLDRDALVAAGAPEGLITVSVHAPPNSIDLTLLAEGGPVWMCGYDDHSLPPVRGGGNQGFHTAGHWAAIAALVALNHREATGTGQHVDVDAVLAASVTTEMGSYGYLAAGVVPMRQTGRHAMPVVTQPTQIRCADGRYINAGIGARKASEFHALLAWLDDLGLRDEFEGTPFLEMGTEYEFLTAELLADPIVQQIAITVREAQEFVASRVSAYEYFVSCQRRGLTAGVIYAPEEVLDDPHFLAREWPAVVEHEDLGRSFTYPGVPYRLTGTPASVRRRAPHLGERLPD